MVLPTSVGFGWSSSRSFQQRVTNWFVKLARWSLIHDGDARIASFNVEEQRRHDRENH